MTSGPQVTSEDLRTHKKKSTSRFASAAEHTAAHHAQVSESGAPGPAARSLTFLSCVVERGEKTRPQSRSINPSARCFLRSRSSSNGH
ncbi:hypothetical protein EYF80_049797 [Liparis tanakae]|uniref:Uncharacterized protein n=1 Tax=Liparis tanakae TaxID=230148 RepID=A0A4Z2FGK9_9TELE|nr:hypothetical protein EYF80_049797 [Liparis tanakae]